MRRPKDTQPTRPRSLLGSRVENRTASGSPIRLAYVLAASHSGSTLLAMLLNTHPDICTVGELKATNLGDPDRYRCSCGELLRECRFWKEVSARMTRRGFTFDIAHAGTDMWSSGSAYTRFLLRPLCRGPVLEGIRDAAFWLSPTWARVLPEVQRRNAALAEVVCEIAGARVIVDSSKVGLRLKYLLRNPGLDVRVIHLVRDGRAVALTYMDPLLYASAIDEAGAERSASIVVELARPMAKAAHEWRRCNEEAEALLASLDPARRIQIRYEDLCADPDGVLEHVYQFLGVDPARAGGDFRSVEHHIVGNAMRMDSTSEVRQDDRWRTVLVRRDLEVFDKIAGDLNRRYGYESGVGV